MRSSPPFVFLLLLVCGFTFPLISKGQQVPYGSTPFVTLATPGPRGLVLANDGSLYATSGHAIERIDAYGCITRLAGQPLTSGSADGVGTAALFNDPIGLAVDPAGTLYVADSANHAIRKVSQDGVVTTLAGLIEGNTDGLGLAARFRSPHAVAVAPNGDVYVIDRGNGQLRRVTPAGEVTTLWRQDGLTGVACDETGAVFFSAVEEVFGGKSNPDRIFARVFRWTDSGSPTLLGAFVSQSYGGLPGLSGFNSGALSVIGRRFIVSCASTAATLNLHFGSLDGDAGVASFVHIGALTGYLSLAVSPQGTLYVADTRDHSIKCFAPLGSPPALVTVPEGGLISYRGRRELLVQATGSSPLGYQWYRDHVPIPGANGPTYSATRPGHYQVKVSNPAGSVLSEAVEVKRAQRLANVSARIWAGAETKVGIVGFVVEGETGINKEVLVRAAGPALAAWSLSPRLTDPVLELFDRQGQRLASNRGWNQQANAAEIAATTERIGAFPFALNSHDSALLVSLPPGDYTAQVRGAKEGEGITLAEVYEVGESDSELINLSTRAFVGASQSVAIGGIAIRGQTPARILVRAVGPGLSEFAVSPVLPRPVLQVFDEQERLIDSNQGWTQQGSERTEAIRVANEAAGAFALSSHGQDSALLLTLLPGNYTAVVRDAGGGEGICLLEAYQVP